MKLSRDVELFRELSESEFLALEEITEAREVEAGAIVVKQGQPTDAIYVLASGLVRVTAIMELSADSGLEDEEMLVSLGPGEVFGELSFVTGEAPNMSVIAEEASVLQVLPHHRLSELIDRDGALCRKLLFAITRTLVARLRMTGRELVLSRYFLRGRE